MDEKLREAALFAQFNYIDGFDADDSEEALEGYEGLPTDFEDEDGYENGFDDVLDEDEPVPEDDSAGSPNICQYDDIDDFDNEADGE